jgi:hypothetical protein
VTSGTEWSRNKTFWIVVAVILGLIVLVNVFTMTLAAGDGGIDVGPIETQK